MSRVLTVTIKDKSEDFEGKDKAAALVKLRQRLETLSDADLVGVELENGYKEYRRIVTVAWSDEDYSWGVEVSENGCGDTKPYHNRADAVSYFLRCAEEKGEHWD